VPERSEVRLAAVELLSLPYRHPAAILSNMTPTRVAAALLGLLVLTLLCYIILLVLYFQLGQAILEYLDAVVDLAQLS